MALEIELVIDEDTLTLDAWEGWTKVVTVADLKQWLIAHYRHVGLTEENVGQLTVRQWREIRRQLREIFDVPNANGGSSSSGSKDTETPDHQDG